MYTEVMRTGASYDDNGLQATPSLVCVRESKTDQENCAIPNNIRGLELNVFIHI